MVYDRRAGSRAKNRELPTDYMLSEIAGYKKFHGEVIAAMSNASYRFPVLIFDGTGFATNIRALEFLRRGSHDNVVQSILNANSAKDQESKDRSLGGAQSRIDRALGELALAGTRMKDLTPRQFYDNLEYFVNGLEKSRIIGEAGQRVL